MNLLPIYYSLKSIYKGSAMGSTWKVRDVEDRCEKGRDDEGRCRKARNGEGRCEKGRDDKESCGWRMEDSLFLAINLTAYEICA